MCIFWNIEARFSSVGLGNNDLENGKREREVNLNKCDNLCVDNNKAE